MRNKLIGSLIGIVRACNNNPKKDSTDSFIIECINALKNDEQEKFAELIERAADEKNLIAPDCALCTARCGGTDNYDMSQLESASEDIRTIKLDIIDEIYKTDDFNDDSIEGIYYGLFAVGENWTAEQLKKVMEEIKKCH